MATCSNCGGSNIESDVASGNSVCVDCATVLEENTIVAEVTFAETSTGAAVPLGQMVTASSGNKPKWIGQGFSGHSRESREITIATGRRYIQQVASAVRLSQYHVEAAHRLFLMAIEHNFIQGRKTQHVVATCLYIICRRERTPHMLIDFSDVLQINVFILGNTYLKFARILGLHLPVIDPSLYIHRFASKLEFGDKTHTVAMTAIRLVSRMKRDWMQVGRRPSGLCGAGILIAARLHGFRRTQKEIIHVVKICDMTLRKRLSEFEETPSAQLTPGEFETIELEEEADPPSFMSARGKRQKTTKSAASSFSITTAAAGAVVAASSSSTTTTSSSSVAAVVETDLSRNVSMEELEKTTKVIEANLPIKSGDVDELSFDVKGVDDAKDFLNNGDELQGLDEDELDQLILNEQEVKIKSEIWHEMNKEYLAEQEAKRKMEENGKKVRKRSKRKKDSRLAPVAETAEEATKAVLAQKKISKKLNYQKLTEGLFEVDEPSLLSLQSASTGLSKKTSVSAEAPSAKGRREEDDTTEAAAATAAAVAEEDHEQEHRDRDNDVEEDYGDEYDEYNDDDDDN